jgi:hypothetical protein
MTKLVRIENADTAAFKVKVEIFDKRPDGDVLVETIRLDHPTAMTDSRCYLTSSRYIKVSEVGPDEV